MVLKRGYKFITKANGNKVMQRMSQREIDEQPNEEKVIHLFRTQKDNSVRAIAEALNMRPYKVDQILNIYLAKKEVQP